MFSSEYRLGSSKTLCLRCSEFVSTDSGKIFTALNFCFSREVIELRWRKFRYLNSFLKMCIDIFLDLQLFFDYGFSFELSNSEDY